MSIGVGLLLGLSTSVDLSRPAGILAVTLILLGALLISTGLILHTLNFRVKELHSVITRRPGL